MYKKVSTLCKYDLRYFSSYLCFIVCNKNETVSNVSFMNVFCTVPSIAATVIAEVVIG